MLLTLMLAYTWAKSSNPKPMNSCLGTVWLKVVCPGDHLPDWELRLLPCITRGSFHLSLTQKRSKFKIWSTVSTECIWLSCHCEIHKSKVELSWVRDVCIIQFAVVINSIYWMVSASITLSPSSSFSVTLSTSACVLSVSFCVSTSLSSHFLCGSHSPFLICRHLLFVGRSHSVCTTHVFFHSLFLLSLSHSLSSSPSLPPCSSSLSFPFLFSLSQCLPDSSFSSFPSFSPWYPSSFPFWHMCLKVSFFLLHFYLSFPPLSLSLPLLVCLSIFPSLPYLLSSPPSFFPNSRCPFPSDSPWLSLSPFLFSHCLSNLPK